jgi:hypothetical protein
MLYYSITKTENNVMNQYGKESEKVPYPSGIAFLIAIWTVCAILTLIWSILKAIVLNFGGVMAFAFGVVKFVGIVAVLVLAFIGCFSLLAFDKN